MILQELVKYYERKLEEGEMPEPGFLNQKIRFEVTIDTEGNFVEVIDLRGEKKNDISLRLCPEVPDRSRDASQKAGFIVDKAEYLFGNSKDYKFSDYANSYEQRIKDCYALNKDNDLSAILLFLDRIKNQKLPNVIKEKIITEKQGPLITFRINTKQGYVWENSDIRKWIIASNISSVDEESNDNNANNVFGQCLVSGNENVLIARKQGKLKAGSVGDKNAGLVDFNDSAYESYSKKQSYNAPISIASSYAYIKALKILTNVESKQKLKITNISLVYWSEKKSDMEELFGGLFETSEKDRKDKEKQDIVQTKEHFVSPFSGKYRKLLQEETTFFILGLSPNAARISIRFWYPTTVGEVSRNIEQHFQDLKLEIPNYESGFLSLYRILCSTAVQGKYDNVNPLLAGKIMTSILNGSEYPRMLLSALLIRIKAEQRINFERISLIKAVLNRKGRLDENFRNEYKFKEFKTIMDESNTNVAYRLGRLFAVMEKLQQSAIGGNKTIKDGYFASASTRPASVFARLFTLSNHHASKLGNKSIWYEKMKGEIIAPLKANIPKTFKLEEQGMFAIGYYQQREELFKKKEDKQVNEGEQK